MEAETVMATAGTRGLALEMILPQVGFAEGADRYGAGRIAISRAGSPAYLPWVTVWRHDSGTPCSEVGLDWQVWLTRRRTWRRTASEGVRAWSPPSARSRAEEQIQVERLLLGRRW